MMLSFLMIIVTYCFVVSSTISLKSYIDNKKIQDNCIKHEVGIFKKSIALFFASFLSIFTIGITIIYLLSKIQNTLSYDNNSLLKRTNNNFISKEIKYPLYISEDKKSYTNIDKNNKKDINEKNIEGQNIIEKDIKNQDIIENNIKKKDIKNNKIKKINVKVSFVNDKNINESINESDLNKTFIDNKNKTLIDSKKSGFIYTTYLFCTSLVESIFFKAKSFICQNKIKDIIECKVTKNTKDLVETQNQIKKNVLTYIDAIEDPDIVILPVSCPKSNTINDSIISLTEKEKKGLKPFEVPTKPFRKKPGYLYIIPVIKRV